MKYNGWVADVMKWPCTSFYVQLPIRRVPHHWTQQALSVCLRGPSQNGCIWPPSNNGSIPAVLPVWFPVLLASPYLGNRVSHTTSCVEYILLVFVKMNKYDTEFSDFDNAVWSRTGYWKSSSDCERTLKMSNLGVLSVWCQGIYVHVDGPVRVLVNVTNCL